jgi:hypothetical protein
VAVVFHDENDGLAGGLGQFRRQPAVMMMMMI